MHVADWDGVTKGTMTKDVVTVDIEMAELVNAPFACLYW